MAESSNITLGTPPNKEILGPEFVRLSEIIAQLRSPEGCPWDREQTLESIKPHTLEEVYELLEAIDSGDDAAIVEELGDVLLQVLLDAQIGADAGRFNLIDVVRRLSDKMISRHPHVFGDAKAETAAEGITHWHRMKAEEQATKLEQRDSLLDGLPVNLPQLAVASRLSDRAARVGFDFPHREMLFDKLKEEIEELAAELFDDGAIPDMPATVAAEIVPDEPIADEARRARVENELGDLLFVAANIARRWKINPEEALRKTNSKFRDRFHYIEDQLALQGRTLEEATLQEMEDLYQQGKQR